MSEGAGGYAEVIGDPIAHSKSPLIHGFWLERLGIDARYERRRVRAGELADYLAERRDDPAWRGCNVTVPHKEAALALVDRLDPLAQRVGAVNTVVRAEHGRLVGHNTDVAGVRGALVGMTSPERGIRQVDIIGAGGAARAAGAAGIGEAVFHNRTRARANALAEAFSGAAAPLDALADGPPREARHAWIVINASTLGMTGMPSLPIDLDRYPRGTIVFDMVYAPLETPLLAAARARGMRTVDGLAMLIAQAAHAFELFFGQPAPRECDAELRQLLTS